jgi:hypothetical protein
VECQGYADRITESTYALAASGHNKDGRKRDLLGKYPEELEGAQEQTIVTPDVLIGLSQQYETEFRRVRNSKR